MINDIDMTINWDSIKETQDLITKWADENFPNRTAHQALSKLVLEEVPELLHSLKPSKKGGDISKEHLEEEFADTLILLFDLASLWNVSIQSGLYRKMEINRQRKWVADAAGIQHHVEE
jgi:NTP pyrophosphatase (non-canonical NTP hydrolase)